MQTLQVFLIALIGGLVGILTYQMLKKPVVQEKKVEIVESPVLPYWTAYSPGYDYWPRWYDSYWLNYVPFYGPITGGYGYGGHHYAPKHHWDGGYHRGGHTGVAVGGGGPSPGPSGGGGHGPSGGPGPSGGGGGGHGGH